jgi:hypothetical protein
MPYIFGYEIQVLKSSTLRRQLPNRLSIPDLEAREKEPTLRVAIVTGRTLFTQVMTKMLQKEMMKTEKLIFSHLKRRLKRLLR